MRPDAVSTGRRRHTSSPAAPRRGLAPVSPFQRLATTHGLSTAADVALVVALADSFLSLDAGAARSKVLLYLVISVAPFAVVAPLIGPFLDRVPGGRRMAIVLTLLVRAAVYVMLIGAIDTLAMFPLAFVVLVMQKTYGVSKSALVPLVVRSNAELIEANSKLGLLAGVSGAGAAVMFGTAALISTKLALAGGAALHVYTAFVASKLPADVVAARPPQRAERDELRQPGLVLAAGVMALLRGVLGFLFFHLFFWIRAEQLPTYWLGLAVASVTIGVMTGNAAAPLLRRVTSERTMMVGALVAVAVAAVAAVVLDNVGAAVLLSAVANMASAVCRMAFESIVQANAPDANKGRVFAKFETRFQLSWVLAGVLPTLITMPGWVGFLIVGIAAAVGAAVYLAGGVNAVLTAPDGQPRVRVPRFRQGSAAPGVATSGPRDVLRRLGRRPRR